jgi:hypothetical protein
MGSLPTAKLSMSWKPGTMEEAAGQFPSLLDGKFVDFFWCIWHAGVRF